MKPRKDIGNVDSAMEKLGIWGKYSLVQFSIQILCQFAVGHHMLSIVFTGQKNPFRCPTPGANKTDSVRSGILHTLNTVIDNTSRITFNSICHTTNKEEIFNTSVYNTTTCSAYGVEYSLPKDRFFVSEFDLVCEREHLAGLAQTLLTLGHAIGSMAFPYFADNYGRKPIVLICSFLWLGSALGLAFSVNYIMFAVFKTLVGVFLQGCSQTSVTIMIEILTAGQRGVVFGCLAYVFWTLGIILMVPVAYLLRNYSWRILELAYCSYFIFIVLYVLFMDESLRWLAANGLRERVMKILEKASKWNGRNLEDVITAFYKDDEIEMNQLNNHDEITGASHVKTAIEVSADGKERDSAMVSGLEVTTRNGKAVVDSEAADEKLNCLSLVKEGKLRFYSSFAVLAWFFNSLTYYALFLMSASLSGSLYLNYFLNCAVELPSAVFIYFYIDRLGRKVCFAAFSLTAGLSLIGMAITSGVSDQLGILITVLAIIGKFGISGSFATIYTMTPELFPTTVRNTGFGIANMSACVGGMLAPFADLLMSKVVYAPGLIFGSGSLILSVWAYFLPETAKRQLPQSLRDIQKWSPQRTDRRQRAEDTAEASLKVNSHVTK